jgi:uncharacterized repeat protein (TIGR01451 family)
MNHLLKRLMGTSAVVVGVMAGTPAFAAGTTANSSIVNTATVNYNVGTVAQTAIQASNTIVVDRRVNLTVVQLGSTTTSVSPNQTQAATTFTITNTSNAPIDIGLSAANLTGGTAPNSAGTDAFDVGTFTYYLDNGDGIFNAADTLITYLDEVGVDAANAKVVHVVASIPSTATNGQIAAISLTGQAKEAGTAGTQGANIAATAGANTAAMDTVLGDGAGTDDTAGDGRHSTRDDYTVAAPTLTVTKLSRVISDPINGTTNPKMIPGAVVEYCISVANTGSLASNVIITDPIPSQTSRTAANTTFGIWEGGTIAAGVCSGGTNTGTFASPTVTGNLGTVANGATETVYFQVTIN